MVLEESVFCKVADEESGGDDTGVDVGAVTGNGRGGFVCEKETEESTRNTSTHDKFLLNKWLRKYVFLLFFIAILLQGKSVY